MTQLLIFLMTRLHHYTNEDAFWIQNCRPLTARSKTTDGISSAKRRNGKARRGRTAAAVIHNLESFALSAEINNRLNNCLDARRPAKPACCWHIVRRYSGYELITC
jgi:hypothetical protein